MVMAAILARAISQKPDFMAEETCCRASLSSAMVWKYSKKMSSSTPSSPMMNENLENVCLRLWFERKKERNEEKEKDEANHILTSFLDRHVILEISSANQTPLCCGGIF